MQGQKNGHGASLRCLASVFLATKRLLHSIPRLTPRKHCKCSAVLIIGTAPKPRFLHIVNGHSLKKKWKRSLSHYFVKPSCVRSTSGAEGVRFELTRPLGLPVFKTGAINRSATPPGRAFAVANSLLHYPPTPSEIRDPRNGVLECWSNKKCWPR